MTKNTTEQAVLSMFYGDSEMADNRESFWGEQDIEVNLSDINPQDICTPCSLFSFSTESQLGSGYVAGITNLSGSDFSFDSYLPQWEANYCGFYCVNDNFQSVVIDAEKGDSNDDSTLCWAAADSNILYRTGWITLNTNKEDDILELYRHAFLSGSTNGGIPYCGLDWYLTGHYDTPDDGDYDQLKPNTGAAFSSCVSNVSNYVRTYSAQQWSINILTSAINELRKGNGVALTVTQYDFSNNSFGHVITLHGFSYDDIENSNSIKVTGLIVSDSDDDWNYADGQHESEDAPNKLVVIPLHYIMGDLYLDYNYNLKLGLSPAKMTWVTALSPAKFDTLYNNGVLVSSAAVFNDKSVLPLMEMNVSFGGLANRTVLAGGSAHVFGGGKMILDNQAAATGNVTLGGKLVANNNITCNNLNVVFQLDANTPANSPSPDVDTSLITNLSNMGGISSLGLNIDGLEKYGTYTLASNGSADFLSTRTVTVTNISNNITSGSLNSQTSTLPFNAGPNRNYTLSYVGGVMTLDVGGPNIDKTTRCDFHYNGISDVIYISGGTDGQTIQYGLDGTSELQNLGPQSSDLHFVGGYDMNSDHRADVVTHRKIEFNSSKCIEIGYAQSGDQFQWHEISRFDNPGDINWVVYCGNLTGNGGKNSILWHAPSIGELGYWADGGGLNSWVGIGNVYDSSWEVIGLGDFINDSVRKDAVLFKYDGSAVVEITASGGYRALGTLGSGWDIVAIGDFSNDGVDDLILYNGILCQVGKWTDGVSTGWSSLGLVETGTTIEGAGDYDGDGGMDLLARKSDGTMGYYASANLSQFTSFGYTMDSSWTVIA